MKRMVKLYLWLLAFVTRIFSIPSVFAEIMVHGRYYLLLPFVPVALAVFLVGVYRIRKAWEL